MCSERPPSFDPLSGLPPPPSLALPLWPSALRVESSRPWDPFPYPSLPDRSRVMPLITKAFHSKFNSFAKTRVRNSIAHANNKLVPFNAPHDQSVSARAAAFKGELTTLNPTC